MAKTTNISSNITIAGTTISNNASITSDTWASWTDTLEAADGGSLTTRTSDTEGVVTLDDSSHALETGDVLDLYWTGGKRRGVAVTISVNEATISGGSGDVLPTQGSDISVAKVKEVDMDFNPTNMQAIAVSLNQGGQLVFINSSNAELANYTLVANQGWMWYDGNGYDNPLTDSTDSSSDDDYVSKMRISTSSEATSTITGNAGWAYDASLT